MRRVEVIACCLAMMIPGSVLGEAAPPHRRSFHDDIERIVSSPPLKHAVVGIDIEDEDGHLLAARNSHQLMVPASVRKLFAAFTVEECEGLDSTIPTEVLLSGAVEHGHLRGNLVIRGHGDPSLGGRLDGWSDSRLRAVLEALAARGVEAIDGSVVADVAAFDRVTIPPEWRSGDLGAHYAAPVDALAYEENLASVTIDGENCASVPLTTDPQFIPLVNQVGCGGEPLHLVFLPDNTLSAAGGLPRSQELNQIAIAVANPALYTAQEVTDFLQRAGVVVSGPPSVATVAGEDGELIATLQSPWLASLLSVMLQNSQNLYAEMLLKQLADSDGPATYAAALSAERAVLVASCAIDGAEFRFVDGSGLSTGNIVTPRAVVQILRSIAAKSDLGDLLARPGVDGTLHHRLLDLPQLRAKTGTLSGVACIAGWVPRPDGTRRFFALLVNNATGDPAKVDEALDAIVRRIAAER